MSGRGENFVLKLPEIEHPICTICSTAKTAEAEARTEEETVLSTRKGATWASKERTKEQRMTI